MYGRLSPSSLLLVSRSVDAANHNVLGGLHKGSNQNEQPIESKQGAYPYLAVPPRATP